MFLLFRANQGKVTGIFGRGGLEAKIQLVEGGGGYMKNTLNLKP